MHNRLVKILSLSLILIAVFTSCSSDKTGESEKVIKTSAIDEYFFGKEATTDKIREKYEEIETATLKCMNEKGWEYYKIEITDDLLSLGLFTDYTGFGEKEKRETFGYGVFTTLDSKGQFDDDLSNEYYGYEDSGSQSKNEKYLTSLSGEETDKYYSDLFGVEPSQFDEEGSAVDDTDGESDLDDGEGDDYNEDEEFDNGFNENSCSGSAQKKVFGNFSNLETIFSDSQELIDNFYKNKEIKTALNDWKTCVKEKLDTTGKTEINKSVKKVLDKKTLDKSPNESLEESLQNVVNGLLGYDNDILEDVPTTLDESGTSSTSDTIPNDKGFEDSAPEKEFDPKKYTEQEIKLAKLDYQCQEEKYFTAKYKIQRKLEEDFIDSHKDEFKAVKESLSK